MTRTFFAPGKVVVIGEYAVLDGAPALVAAVHHGVRCTVTASDDLQIVTPTGDDRFVAAALRAAQAPAATYTFADDPPAGTAGKPGLGGSAAATTVAVLAARALRGEPVDPPDLWPVAFHTHHAVQGSGSGIDVAASCWGGMTRFERGFVPTSVPACDLVVVYSGESAKTGPRVAAYQTWPGRKAFVKRSAELVEAFADDPIATLRAAELLLADMADQAGIAYRTPGLDRIAALAHRFGGAGKPSGAGGGDCAVAVLPDLEARAAFEAACIEEGFTVLATGLAAGAAERS